jgi:hypothetical protein
MMVGVRQISIPTPMTTFFFNFDPRTSPSSTTPFNDKVHEDKERERRNSENSEPDRNAGKNMVEHRCL